MSDVVRIFISSPADVAFERARAERVAERLAGLIDGLEIEIYRWEAGQYFSAHQSFQPQIPELDRFDLVIGLFWSRVGSPLPPSFPPMPDGRPYPSGTAYELLTAMEHRRQGGSLPDVLIFRKTAPAEVPTHDPLARQQCLEQLQALEAFVAEWLVNDQDGFMAAFTSFRTTDEFEALLEAQLRSWLRDHRRLGRERRWRVEERGSPFVGLEAFGPHHEAVFFGRRADVERARERLEDAAARGCAFLLVDGASGAGKSSLIRAGLLPRLAVLDPDLRTATLRPGGADPLAALAAALYDNTALPELAQGDYQTPADLAAHLAAGGGIQPILRALDRAAEALKKTENRDTTPELRLALLVDQLEELFAKEVEADARARFAATLAALARSGRVLVVATLRADARAAALAEPALQGLIDDGAALALAAPGPEALDAIVREPARAAGLAFERGEDGLGLDEILIRDAIGAEALPLLQFSLAQLYSKAAERLRAKGAKLGDVDPEEPVLTLAVADYGGLESAVRQQAEEALKKVSEKAKAALPRLVRTLTDLAETGEGRSTTRVLRAASLGAAAPDPAARELLDALVKARILVTDGDTVRFAHEQALTAWDRAANAAAEAATFLRVRADIERAERRWRDAGRRRSLLLPSGVRLAEAEAALKSHADELPEPSLAFIRRSRRRARLGQTLTAMAALLFATVAVAAGYFFTRAEDAARQAEAARDDAEQALRTATQAANTLVFDLAREFKNRGLPSSLTRVILDRARALQDTLAERFPDDDALRRSRSVSLAETGDMLARQGDGPAALDAYIAGLAISRELRGKDPDNTEWAGDVSVSLDRIGDVRLRAGDAAAALQAFEEALAIRRELRGKDPDNTQWASGVSVSLSKIGDVRLRAGDAAAALQAFEEALAIDRELRRKDPDNTQWARDVAVSLGRIGDLRLRAGDAAAALQAFEEALAIGRELRGKDPDNTEWAGDVSVSLDRIGDVRLRAGDAAAALQAFEEALAIRRELRGKDPDNTQWARNVAVSLTKIGDVRLRAGDAAAALQAFEEALAIGRELRGKDPDNTQWARDVSLSLDRIGDVRLRAGDAAAALQAFEEALAIGRELRGKDPDNTQWARDVSVSLERIGDVRLRAGDAAAALQAFEEALAIGRELRGKDPDNTQWARDVSVSLERIGDVRLRAGDAAAALQAFEEALAIGREQLAGAGRDAVQPQTDIVISLWKIAQLHAGAERVPLLAEALALLEPLVANGVLPPRQQNWPALLRQALAEAEAAAAP